MEGNGCVIGYQCGSTSGRHRQNDHCTTTITTIPLALGFCVSNQPFLNFALFWLHHFSVEKAAYLSSPKNQPLGSQVTGDYWSFLHDPQQVDFFEPIVIKVKWRSPELNGRKSIAQMRRMELHGIFTYMKNPQTTQCCR